MEIADVFDDSFYKVHVAEVLLIGVSGISQKLLYSECLFSVDDVGGELQVGEVLHHFVLCFPVEAIGKDLEYVKGSMVDIDGICNIGQSTESLHFDLLPFNARDVFGH